MQKLPEVSDRKKVRRMRKEKRSSRQEEDAHSLSGSDQRSDNTLLTGGRRHALVLSPVAALSRLTVYRNITTN